ncbi:PP2C family protein-serine/threonine phosphatase [Kitasatospora kifunensis]|uniref:Serine phosphatase RsbU (Regulator of sigma subunit) n=1 Tax=Kitasatospora kifunensis TaxID=58351 RepID=A0A7W7RCE5_KITKI|nr:PP2C family protein-serine/threonine phosphatase [Kitasatospora kifunensis]MBB4928826.1 serine phosphatase RsbU (regulator of sigma subunit) [Kitasatospora kifunensis]
MRLPGRSGADRHSATTPGGTPPRVPAPPAWIRWLPAIYVAAILALEPITPEQWPVSFLLIALPVVAAYAHGPASVAAITVFAVVFEGVLAGTPCCAGRSVGYLWERHYVATYVSTALVGALGAVLAAHRTRRERTLATVRSVAETAQRVLLRPVPHLLGRVSIETLYLSAAAEARIGGDLYEAVSTVHGVRLLIGDVRGKGLLAVETAAATLAAFREAAYDEPDLPGVARRLERSVSRRADQLPSSEERFITTVLAEIPGDEPVVRIVNCGHPPPLLICQGRVSELYPSDPSPPLNLGVLLGGEYHIDVRPFSAGSQLLLYTDGVTETRDRKGEFYPLTERVRDWTALPPRELLNRLHQDLLAYSDAGLDDDIAVLIAYRLPDEEHGETAEPGQDE